VSLLCGATEQAFSPASLFTSGVQGAWYDPSDYSSLFQDSVGTTPVTAVEQPVGLMLDKSQGLVLGSELFESSTPSGTGWTGTNATASGNVVTFSAQFSNRRNATAATSDKWYRYTFTARRISGNTALQLFHENSLSGDYTAFTATGTATTYQVTVRGASAGTVNFGVQDRNASGFGDLEIYDLSVKEIAGNHASQATTASRPVLRARYNSLLYSETFSNSAWQSASSGTGVAGVKTPNFGTAPDGTLTACRIQLDVSAGSVNNQSQIYQNYTSVAGNLTYQCYIKTNDGSTKTIMPFTGSGAAVLTITGTWQLFTVTRTTVGTSDNFQFILIKGTTSDTADLLVWHPQSNPGSSAGTYQRIAAATDYATAGFLPYLAADGVDDQMASAAVNFTTTDKLTAVFGSLSNSTANQGVFQIGNVGAGTMNALYLAGSTIDMRSSVQGSTGNSQMRITGSGPGANAVFSQLYDIAGATAADESQIRFNGTLPTQNVQAAGPAGGGNFANVAITLLQFSGAFFLNGRLYQMVICGKTLSASEIASTEAFVNQKTGAY
jgi:hypothetical protein